MTTTEWVSVQEAARMIGVSKDTIRNYADKGVLPVNRTEGGHRRFKAQDIMRYIEPHTPVVAVYQSM